MAAGSPSLHDLKSLSARLLAAGESKPPDKFDNIKAALEGRDDETLAHLVNQRCVQLRAIGIVGTSGISAHGGRSIQTGLSPWPPSICPRSASASDPGAMRPYT